MKRIIGRRRFLELSAVTTAAAVSGTFAEHALLDAQEASAHAATYSPPASNRVDTLIDTGWKFLKSDASGAQSPTFDDSTWSAVTLPHTWNNIDGENGGTYYRGIGWYRLHYIVPASAAGRRLYLQFDGSSLVTDVYVNGTSLGEHQGGYTRFCFDATAALTVGATNVIAVKVNNALTTNIPPLNGDFTVFGGLYRSVHLIVTDNVHMQLTDYGSSGLFIRQTHVSSASASLQVTAETWNDNATPQSITLNTFIVDASNTVVRTLTSTQTVAAHTGFHFVQTTTMANPHLWDGQRDPYLYHVYAQVQVGTVVKDIVSAPLGLRSYSIDVNKGFFLNGHYLDLHGVNMHQDRLDQGWAISDAELDQDFGLVTAMGANVIRTSHYQHAQRLYDDADAAGVIIWSEQPIIGGIISTTAFTQNAELQLTEMIRQNYNHPSIIFWSIANEVANNAATNTLLQSLNNLAHAQDPDRITTLASHTPSGDALSKHTDTVGYNRYYGWYSGVFSDINAELDNTHKNFPTMSFALSEYGAGASINQHEANPTQPVPASNLHPEEWQALFHEAYWQSLASRPYVWGKFVWVMFDLASASRHEGDHNGRNDKGLVTYDHKTCKDAYFWYKANWTTAPFVYITDRRFVTRTLPTTDIKVYANTSSVTLTVNGVSLGARTSTNHIFLWPAVALQVGNNVVSVVSTQGGNTYTDSVTWTRQ